jgi:hypothetical protein
MTETMNSIRTHWKVKHLNTLEKYPYEMSKNNLQMNNTNTDNNIQSSTGNGIPAWRRVRIPPP